MRLDKSAAMAVGAVGEDGLHQGTAVALARHLHQAQIRSCPKWCIWRSHLSCTL